MIDINLKYRYSGLLTNNEARILCTDRQGIHDGNKVLSMDSFGDVHLHIDNGVCAHQREYDLIEVKEKKVIWLNLYRKHNDEIFFRSKEEADQYSNDGRFARIRVEYQEGQFDD
jgi:hypothetical protein